ncbi:MAG TPA: hypothetical protein VEL47_02690 [Myxococcota bacterium]|nr:hypothetical protein [Myxococcota bacterium]
MSRKLMTFYKSTFLVNLIVFSIGISGCDPCRQLAELICSCKGEESKQQCISELSVAAHHEHFSAAKEQRVCEEALKKGCTCQQINNNDDAECGQYRRSAQ